MNLLSSFNRSLLLQNLSSQTFDLLIIGGGITGAGIALDAASRGLKVALVEKQDFAAGTSSRSTKLIHGGLRYLKNFELGLVMEVAQERKIIFRNAPHLVSQEKLLLPLIRNGSFGKFITSIGLTIYDVLACVNSNDWHKILSRKETINEEPLLQNEILIGSGFYSEYRTDDARLTIEVIKTAVKYGANTANYVEAKRFLYSGKKISGAECEDIFSGSKFNINAGNVVNAAGPWVDAIRDKETEDGRQKSGSGTQKPEDKKRLHLTKGVHIVISKEKFPLRHSVYFDVEDGRMIFAIPRGKTTYVGTTDTNYNGNLENPLISKQDVGYLINAANKMFPSIKLSTSDVISSWAGLRPLIHEEGKSPSELSRKDEIFVSASGLISIAGGKLTGYRKMAKKTVDLVCKRLKLHAPCMTRAIIITGGEFEKPSDVKKYIEQLSEIIKEKGVETHIAEYLVRNYGKQSDEILKKWKEFEKDNPGQNSFIQLVKAELWFSVNYESVYKPEDFLLRRTGRILFEPASILESLPFILDELKNYFQWDEARFEKEKNEILKSLRQTVTFE